MKLLAFKDALTQLSTVSFALPNGEQVPAHFHVTEVGLISKHYIDCGGTTRHETRVGFQLWSSTDTDHELRPDKLLSIVNMAEERLLLPNAEIEVEYQGSTIGKYGLSFNGDSFMLTTTQTDCLAKDKCGIPEDVPSKKEEIQEKACVPGSGCC